MTITPRGRGLLVAAAVLWITARSFAVPQLQIAAAAVLVLLVGSALWVLLWPVGLTARRTVTPSRVAWGEQVEVRVDLRATGRLVPPVTLQEQLPRAMAGPAAVHLAPMRRGEETTVTSTLTADMRGRHRLGPTTARVQDPFGVVARTRVLTPDTQLLVHPPVVGLPAGLPLGGATGGTNPARRQAASTGDELADLRPYVRGDDLRSVHWPSTARRGALMVRRNEQTGGPQAVVLFDRRADRHRGHGPRSSFETTLALTASVGNHLAERGRAVVLCSDPAPHRAAPRSWQDHLDDLAGATTAPVELRAVVRQLTEGTVGSGTLIAIITTPDAAELRELVAAGHGFAVRAVAVIDAASFTTAGHDTGADAAVAAARSAGWHATAVRSGDPLDASWQDLLLPARRSRSGAS